MSSLAAGAQIALLLEQAGNPASHQSSQKQHLFLQRMVMKGPLIAAVLFTGLMAETTIPVIAATQTKKTSTNRRRRSRRNRRIRNTAIGAAGGVAGGALIGGGRGARVGTVVGGAAGALSPTRR
jgi:uncharacterized protein YcfJ